VLPPDELWRLERKRDVNLDAVYGPGTVALSAHMRALVLLRWRRGGGAARIRLLEPSEALTYLPLYYKDLGVFDLDREPGGAPAADRERPYRVILRRVILVEMTGGAGLPAPRQARLGPARPITTPGRSLDPRSDRAGLASFTPPSSSCNPAG
jgi:HprK-related kinase B